MDENQIIEIDDDDDTDIPDVIDLDEIENTPEVIIAEWDLNVRRKLSKCSFAETETVLDDLMREYLCSLRNIVQSYEVKEEIKNKVLLHVNFLYSYYAELQCCALETYLTHMEEILTVYCNLELDVVSRLRFYNVNGNKFKRQVILVLRRLIQSLTVYLLERHDRILHVLIKIDTNRSDCCSNIMDRLYCHFLTKVANRARTDEAFCRNYIVFQKWKDVRSEKDWPGIDSLMYKAFNRTPESIRKSETLKKLLFPPPRTASDIVMALFKPLKGVVDAYFNHVQEGKKDLLDFVERLDFCFRLGEDEAAVIEEDDEDVQIIKCYREVERNMSNLPQVATSDPFALNIFPMFKKETDEDDDVEFVGVIFPEPIRSTNHSSDEEVPNSDGITRELDQPEQPSEPPFSTPVEESQEPTVESEEACVEENGVHPTPVQINGESVEIQEHVDCSENEGDPLEDLTARFINAVANLSKQPHRSILKQPRQERGARGARIKFADSCVDNEGRTPREKSRCEIIANEEENAQSVPAADADNVDSPPYESIDDLREYFNNDVVKKMGFKPADGTNEPKSYLIREDYKTDDKLINQRPFVDMSGAQKAMQQREKEMAAVQLEPSGMIRCDYKEIENKRRKADPAQLRPSPIAADPILPTAVPETYDFSRSLKNEVFAKLADVDDAARLPLKKRKLPPPERPKENELPVYKEISYPATKMMSIAEVEVIHPRKSIKTAAEKKELPTSLPDCGGVVAEHFNVNNHTYNNPTINYHMNNVPFVNLPFGQCYSFSPVLVPYGQRKDKEKKQRRRH